MVILVLFFFTLILKQIYIIHKRKFNKYNIKLKTKTILQTVLHLYYENDVYWKDANASERMVSGCAWVSIGRGILSAAAHNYHFISAKYTKIMWSIDYVSIVFTLTYFAIQTESLIFWCFNWYVRASLAASLGMFGLAVAHSSLLHDKSVREVTFGMLALGCVLFPLLYFGYICAFNEFSDNKIFNTRLGTIEPVLVVTWIVAIIAFILAVIVRDLEFPEKLYNEKKYKHSVVKRLNRQIRCVDNWVTSHQIWHLGVNLGAYLSVYTLFWLLKWRVTKDSCPN